jgi:hypothetical protein
MNEAPTGVEFATEAAEMFDAITEVLRGHHPYVQGAVLADLLAMFIAGHSLVGDAKGTDQMRENLLAEHIKAVRLLIAPNEKIIAERQANPTRHHH